MNPTLTGRRTPFVTPFAAPVPPADNQAELKRFWEEAKTHGWRMSWEAWKTLVLAHGKWGVHNDDSNITDDTQISADRAHDCFKRCTIAPERCFK